MDMLSTASLTRSWMIRHSIDQGFHPVSVLSRTQDHMLYSHTIIICKYDLRCLVYIGSIDFIDQDHGAF